jgi:hypothetical protein
MALSLEEILGFVPLTAYIETVKAGVPKLLPPAFYARNPAFRVLGDKTRRIEVAGTRKNARIVPYGAPPRQIEHLPLSGRDIRLIHTEEKLQFSHELFLQIREYESYTVMQKLAEETRRQVSAEVTRMENLLASSVHVLIANGKLWFDTDGSLLATSSGADLEIDFGVPAANLNQLNGIIDASWALSTTNIPLHLKRLRERARFTTGYPLKYALYGKNVMSHLLRNQFVKDYLVSLGGADRAKAFLDSGEIPSKMFDFEWIPMNETFFDTEAGVTTEVWGEDTVVFTPDPSDQNVYGIYEGSYPVLKQFSMSADVIGQMSNWDHEYGRYGYGFPSFPPNPLGLFGVYGDNFLPSLHNPAAWFIADVTP